MSGWIMVPTETLQDLSRDALQYILQRNYTSLADLVQKNEDLARVHGQKIVEEMFHSIDKSVDFGYQLTGDQLKTLAYVRKAGAPMPTMHLGKSVDMSLTVGFEYVARIEREGRKYWAGFPDLAGCLGIAVPMLTLKEAKNIAREGLVDYLGYNMLLGNTLPAPKYHGRKTEKVRPFKVQLTLADLVFEDRITPEEIAAELELHRRRRRVQTHSKFDFRPPR